MSIGVNNVTINSTQSSQLTINQSVSSITDVVARYGVGTRPLTGILILGFVAYLLYDYDASLDLGAAIMIPLTFVLGNYGWLPYGSGILYALLVVVAGMLSYGAAKFVTR